MTVGSRKEEETRERSRIAMAKCVALTFTLFLLLTLPRRREKLKKDKKALDEAQARARHDQETYRKKCVSERSRTFSLSDPPTATASVSPSFSRSTGSKEIAPSMSIRSTTAVLRRNSSWNGQQKIHG